MPIKKDCYKTIKQPSKGVFKDKRSEFYAFAYPIETEDESKIIRQKLKKEYHDAKHHVYAMRLGYDMSFCKMSDDGEPHNSSAPSILSQIKSYELSDILIVVVRYFGGKKLGIPGLINAYKQAAISAIEHAEIVEKIASDTVKISFSFEKINDVMQIIKKENINIINKDAAENAYYMELSIRKSKTEDIIKTFNKFNIKTKQ